MKKTGDFSKDHISLKRMAEGAGIPLGTLRVNVKYLMDMLKDNDVL